MSTWSDPDAPPVAPSLEDQVKALQVGDKVRAVFEFADLPHPVVVETRLHDVFDGAKLKAGSFFLRDSDGSPYKSLTSVEVLEPAKPAPVPFYTNAPAERLPRIGDVARGYVGTNVYVGDGWVATAARGSGREVYHPFRFDAGRLALVDPAELAKEES